MTTYIDTKIITLTSQSASIKKNGSYLSNVRYELGLFLKDDSDIIHRQIQLLNAQIPYSFYVINYTNQFFRANLGSGITTYTIPVGNYTANSLITTINTVISQSSFVITFSNTTGKLTFSHTTNTFTIYNNFQYSIGNVLGFADNSTYTSTGTPNTLIAPYPLNLLGIKVLQVRSANLSMNNVSSVGGGFTTLLSSIPVSAVPFGMIDYKDTGNNLLTITNTTLDDIDLDIIDGESGEYVNFNNQDWCITLALHIHRTTFDKSGAKPLGNQQNPALPNTNKNLEDLNILLGQ
jgi:hypothetical protein